MFSSWLAISSSWWWFDYHLVCNRFYECMECMLFVVYLMQHVKITMDTKNPEQMWTVRTMVAIVGNGDEIDKTTKSWTEHDNPLVLCVCKLCKWTPIKWTNKLWSCFLSVCFVCADIVGIRYLFVCKMVKTFFFLSLSFGKLLCPQKTDDVELIDCVFIFTLWYKRKKKYVRAYAGAIPSVCTFYSNHLSLSTFQWFPSALGYLQIR